MVSLGVNAAVKVKLVISIKQSPSAILSNWVFLGRIQHRSELERISFSGTGDQIYTWAGLKTMEEIGGENSAFEMMYAADHPIKHSFSFASITVNTEHGPFDTNRG